MDEVMDIEMKLELAGKMSGEIWEKIMCLIITRRNSMRALFTTYYLCHSCLCFCVLYFFLVKSYECIVTNWIFRIRLCYCSCRVWVCMVGLCRLWVCICAKGSWSNRCFNWINRVDWIIY